MNDIEIKIDFLEKMYNQTLNHVNSSINLFWMILFGLISISGIALYFLAKSAIETGIRNGVSEMKKENEELRKDVLAIIDILSQMFDED